MRSIRSDVVRYPVDDPRAPECSGAEGWRASTRSLPSACDTGLALQGRLAREARRRERERRQRTAVAVATLIGIALLVIGWRQTSDRKAASLSADAIGPTTSLVASDTRTSPAMPSWTRGAAGMSGLPSIKAALIAQPDPTPIIATLGSLKIRLPVRLEDLTELGFHQASYAYALHMHMALPKANMVKAKKNGGTGRDLAKQRSGEDAVLTGRALVMWRSRPGAPDSAADVGAKAGSDVLAPVSGVVVKIKRYKLYGKYDDLEVHIRPDDARHVDCVLIHVDDLSVSVGDRVTSGVTRIAAVRLLSDREKMQLADYTGEAGDHVHIQMNDIRHPDYKGLEGAIDPKSVPRITRSSAVPVSAR